MNEERSIAIIVMYILTRLWLQHDIFVQVIMLALLTDWAFKTLMTSHVMSTVENCDVMVTFTFALEAAFSKRWQVMQSSAPFWEQKM